MAVYSFCLLALLTGAKAALVKQNANDPGSEVWMIFNGCSGQTNPAGQVSNVVAQWADPLWDYWTIPAKYTTADAKHLNAVGQDFFCNASVWVRPTYYVTSLSGKWVFQSSLPWNLCGSGYATGPWKGDSSLWIKTIQAKGALGVTAFFVTNPTKWGRMPEMCAGLTMPTASSSYAQFLGGSKTVGYKLYLAAAYGIGAPTFTIPANENLKKDSGVFGASYAVAVIGALISVATTALAAISLPKLRNKKSFAAAVLSYESVAASARALLLLMCAPMSFGPFVYTGLTHFQDMVTNTMLPSLGHFSTVLTSLMWLKFSFIRQDKPVYNIIIAVTSFAVYAVSFFAATSFMNVYKKEGILAGVAGATASASAFSYNFQMVVSASIAALFLIGNVTWLFKLRKSAGVSAEVARIAKTCLKLMSVQVVLLSLSVMSASAALQSNTDPQLAPTTTNTVAGDQLLNVNGEVVVSMYAFCAMFLDPLLESMIGFVQVVAIRALAISSSSSSSSSS